MKETIDITISKILQENERRRAIVFAPFNPITGEGSIGQRVAFTVSDYPIPTQYLPVEMMDEPFVKSLSKAGSVEAFIRDALLLPVTDEARDKVVEEFIRIRQKHDYPFWAAMFAYIKRKGGGTDVLFRLNRPQRKLIKRLEKMRKAGKPIRLILLKARQWGGSTAIQIYMAWLQLVHEVGLNSLIIAHQGTGSDEIKDMFDRMIKSYPVEMLHELGDAYAPNEPKMVGVGKSGNIFRVPQRNCKIKIGTAERPNSCRGGDYNLVHLSEVALWKETDGKKPEDIVRSACSGILLRPYTMIVYESTPNGVGNFFHKEYLAAKKGLSQFEAMFVAWFEIEQYELPFENEAEKYEFAKKLFANRRNEEIKSDREEPGTYLWRLWEKGATLEAIHWYVSERSKYTNHGDMASEYPSDDIEAFTYSGRKVFSSEDVEQFRPACRAPRWIGEIYGSADEEEKAKEEATKAGTKAVAAVALSPMLKQFLDLKQKHPDALLLFRTGDFYETYKQDAEKASKILGITLTKSSKTKDEQGKPLVMAGFPYHALDTYLPKLIRAGQRVAICDQLEAPKQTAKRGISELVSPGAAAEKEQKAEPEKQQSFHR